MRPTKLMWSFETDNFRVSWEIFEPYDLDLSWDETGEIREGIEKSEPII